MNQNVKLSKAISYVVICLAVLLFLCIWPMGIFKQTYVSKSNEILAKESKEVNVDYNVNQMFVGEDGELCAIDVYVCNDMAGESVAFFLYDSTFKQLYHTLVLVDENQEFPGMLRIPVCYDIIKDQEYYYAVFGDSTDLIVGYEERENSSSIVNGYMTYGGIEIQRYNVISRYEYKMPFSWWQVLLLGGGIAAVTAGLLWGIKMLFEKKIADRDVKVHTVFRAVLNPVVVGLGLMLCLMIFPGRVFGTGIINYAFLGGSIVLLTAVLLYIINFKRIGEAPLVDIEQLKEKLPGYLQSFCIAMALWYCYEYMNGLYDIHHYYATRRMLIWFLLGIVCTYSKKELLKIWNFLYLIVASVASYLYVKPNLDLEEKGGLYELDAYIMVIGGLVILLLVANIIRLLLKKETLSKKLSIPYVLLFALLLGMMVAFRNTRDWVTTMVVLFVLFYLRMWFWNKSDRILTIVGNGILLNFIFMVCYCLVHRPFNRYRLYRYGMGFHTVTVTGVYLSLILSVALVWFLLKYFKTKRLIDTWPQLLLLIVANVYQILTLSRTGYLASFVMEVLVVIIFCLKNGKEKWKYLVRCFAAIISLTILFFPIVFTVTRIVPSFWNDPVYSEVEVFGDQVFKGTPKDSEYYIDIEYYWDKAGEKLLGTEEEEVSSMDWNQNLKQVESLCGAVYTEVRKQIFPQDVFVVNDEIMVASNTKEAEDWDTLDNVSNGRIAIFKDYIAQWNLTGHEEMGFPASFGGDHAHAHNVFLQVIHDHGLITGIIFILFGIASFVIALIRFIKKKDMLDLLIVSVITAFAVSGMAEWNFHLCNPFGLSIFMVVTPLLFKSRNVENNEYGKKNL